tara:strand:- start:446 stop:652 length:207 start_codon:yes stop_codon:yes gene_type:complete
MIGNTCIYPEYEKILISKDIRFEKCISKKSKRLWLKLNPFDEAEHFNYFHYDEIGKTIPLYVRLVLDD